MPYGRSRVEMASAGSDKVWWDSNGFGVSGGSCFGWLALPPIHDVPCTAISWVCIADLSAQDGDVAVEKFHAAFAKQFGGSVSDKVQSIARQARASKLNVVYTPPVQVLERMVRFVIALDGKVNRALFERFIKTFGPFEGCARRVRAASHKLTAQPCLTGGMV